MNKIKELAYNTYNSSGFTSFSNQSTADDTNEYDTFLNPLDSDINMSIDQMEHGKYDVFEVANWFLKKESMSHKKLQKLCYYAQAWCYALKNYRLTDTVFEAWVHGPVSPVMYDKFKSFGYQNIKLVGEYQSYIDEEDIELLESVWETYGDHTGNALEALSHNEAPWIEARMGYAPNERCNIPISVESMKKYYTSIYVGGDA